MVSQPEGYRVDENGVLTGIKAGRYAMKPTGRIVAKSGVEKWLWVNVVNQRDEVESNGTFESANELGTVPTRFYLSTIADVDIFKVRAEQGQKVTFRVKSLNGLSFPMLKWATFGGNTYQQLGGGSVIFNEGQDMVIDDWMTRSLGTGYYYVQLYANPNFYNYFESYSYFTVEAIVGEQKEQGDVNGDGVVDVDDLNIVINIMVRKASFADWPSADVDGNGVMDIDDLNHVINIMVGKG